LIEYANFHAAEHSTIWLFHTKSSAYYWEETEDLQGRGNKMNIKTEVFDEILTQAFSWEQAKPNQPKHPQSFPGYLGFLSFYDKGKSRQMLLSEEDFAICKTEKCDGVKAGRLILALEPIFKEISAKVKNNSNL
jgi:hypothetical protein